MPQYIGIEEVAGAKPAVETIGGTMVNRSDIFDDTLFEQMLAEGYITARPHNELPLVIANYTPETMFSRNWNEVTKACRGLIYNSDTMEIVARPFPRFANWDEQGYPMPPAGPALRMEKADGSLGILVATRGEYAAPDDPYLKEFIATRGSFHSEQAEWATKFYNGYINQCIHSSMPTFFLPKVGKTYLFEIIFKENRIVVDYGDYEGLILLDVIDNETGFPDTDEFDNCKWPDKVTRTPVAGFDSGQAGDIPEGDEGFVYLWPARNFRTKMKSAEYIRIHRLVSSLSEKSVWESMVQGKSIDEIKIGLPEEFHDFIDRVWNEIIRNAVSIVQNVYLEMDEVCRKHNVEDPHEISRKEFALSIKDSKYKNYLFAALDGKVVYMLALRNSKPTKTAPLITEE